MRDGDLSATAVALPGESRLSRLYATADFADAYAICLPRDTIAAPELLARFLFSQQAPWAAALLRLRDALVAGFGIKTSRQLQRLSDSSRDRRITIFKIYETNTHEILLGEDDKHLDFRLSVLLQARTVGAEARTHLILTTVVQCHNRLGRAYIALIAPFHRRIVRSYLRRAARAGWPRT